MKSLFISILPALVAAGPGINPNPDPNFDPSTSQGTFGPFIPAQRAASNANGGPTNIDARSKQAMQLAISNWMTDTGIVSGFLNVGQATNDAQQFTGIADGAFKAEVDELSQKAVLDAVIGQDPRVSIANLTLTNGVFQSVVDNLQIMSIQGTQRNNLVDAINNVRCTQILPSIDTYMVVAAEFIGDNAQPRRAVRPAACGQILAAANSSAFAPLPGTPNGTPAGTGDGNVQGLPAACANPLSTGNNNANNNGANGGNANANNNNNGNGGNANANNNGNNGGNNNANTQPSGNGANAPLSNTTTPQLALPAFGGNGANGNANNGNANNGNANANAGNANANAGNTNANAGNANAGNANAGTAAAANGATGATAKKGAGKAAKGAKKAAKGKKAAGNAAGAAKAGKAAKNRKAIVPF